MIPELNDVKVSLWEAVVGTLGGGGALLGLKMWLRARRELRQDNAEGTAARVAEHTIAAFTKQADRQEEVLQYLTKQLRDNENRLTVEMDARRKAVHESLNAAQSELAAKQQLAAAKIQIEELETDIKAVEKEFEKLKIKIGKTAEDVTSAAAGYLPENNGSHTP